MKYYAVLAGKTPGIYTTWPEAQAQVVGFSGALYKSFKSEDDAKAYLAGGEPVSAQPVASSAVNGLSTTAQITAYSDGSLNPATNVVGASVVLRSGTTEFADKHLIGTVDNNVVDDTRNVGGELLGAIAAIRYAMQQGFTSIEIFYDYQGVGAWADGNWKAKNIVAQQYVGAIANLRRSIDIKFTKVSAHNGVEFNELADRLAKYACGAELKAADAEMLQTLDINLAPNLYETLVSWQ